ncbi:hypothetical protein PENTCL1PPCAC_28470 [Pristionchus entomophagus]|uniref:PDZ domain-containing protein n=1 Tax=Pristionchus entomophagus TaxID=358040 RepID=A0AAV5UGW8_9BILA|nr:hypothetical protein PENTCL1PPCAC_28470 [Pristionchus entomophagus]
MTMEEDDSTPHRVILRRRSLDAVVSSVAELHTVHLHADANIPGQLGFRLVGNRLSGVYVFGMNQDSQQAKILEDGDKLLLCNGVSLQGFTCEQVANIMRLSLCHDGTLTLLASRAVEIKEKMEDRKARRSYLEEESCVDKSHPIRLTSPRLTSRDFVHRRTRITAFEAEKEIPKRTSTIGEGMASFIASLPIVSVKNSYSSRPSEENTRLLSTTPNSTANRRKKPIAHYYLLDGHAETEVVGESSRYRCPICLKYTSMRRLHMLRHEWFSGARRLIPTSTSEFFMGRSTSEYAML